MSVDVKCNKCGSSYNVSDKLAGGSVRCAKCKAPIHVPIVRQQPAPVRAANAAEAAGEADLSFDYTPSLAAGAAVAAPPPPTTKETRIVASDAAGPAETTEKPEEKPQVKSEISAKSEKPKEPEKAATPEGGDKSKPAPKARSRGFEPGKAARLLQSMKSADFDFRFRNYWSRSLARGLWVLSICAAAYLGYLAIGSLSDVAQLPGELRRAAEWTVYVRLFFIVGGLAMLRIGLETVSALFNVAQLLREIRDELRSRN